MEHGPFKIRLLKTVSSDIPFSDLIAHAGEHEAWCNGHGAVVVRVGDRSLGVRPEEFEYVTLPPNGLPLAVTPAGARELADRLLSLVEPAWRDGYCWQRTQLDRAEMDEGWRSSMYGGAVASRQVASAEAD